jgi:AAA domain
MIATPASLRVSSVQDNVRPIIEPDAEQMLCHVEHLFGGDLDGCHQGLIELAWTDPADNSLRHAMLYGTDQLDGLANKAFELNRVPGQNVFIGAALRRPGTAPFGRCGDDDFFALTAFYADLDEGVEAARNLYRERRCPPTAVVVTGRLPHQRAQPWWRLEIPERDPEVCRRQNRALALALGGDPSVVNPGRVLRLGGSIAWPIKPGRTVERTELHTFNDGRPKIYFPGQLAKAFPPVGAERSDPPPNPERNATLNIGSEFDGITVEAYLAAIRAGDHWHNHLVRLTGHWIARGWSDAEILTAAEALTLTGYTVDQTRREVARMIESGRAKWNIPNPEHNVVEPTDLLPPVAPDFLEQLNVSMLPRRRWLLEGTLLRSNVTVEVAPPGAGKSTLGIQQAVAIVTGRPITGHQVREQTKVWVYNNEDDGDELKRRLAAVLQHWDIRFPEIRGQLALNSGADRPLLIAKADRIGNVIRLPDVDACIEHIKAHGIGVFIVDPFVETHEVNENSNEQIKAVAIMFREIARRGKCAVMLVHHTAKPPQGASDGHAGNLNTARGASALVGVARIVQTLFTMSSKDAERYGVPEEKRHRYVRLDDAKANVSLIGADARWFRRVGVTIANGDEVGVLVPEDLEPLAQAGSGEVEDMHRPIIAALLAQVPENEISLNAAAKRLAWSGHTRFERYRETDDKGNQRASRPFREIIMAACQRRLSIAAGGMSRGFTCDSQRKPITLKRFELPASAADLAAQEPEFMEET